MFKVPTAHMPVFFFFYVATSPVEQHSTERCSMRVSPGILTHPEELVCIVQQPIEYCIRFLIWIVLMFTFLQYKYQECILALLNHPNIVQFIGSGWFTWSYRSHISIYPYTSCNSLNNDLIVPANERMQIYLNLIVYLVVAAVYYIH